jgi:hypothetical protein
MILHCSFEEIRALAAGAEFALSGTGPGAGCAVAAPPEVATQIDGLLPRLTGDLEVSTLAEQMWMREVVALIRDGLRGRMKREILAHHPGHEDAVYLYFDYAHVLRVLDRLDRMGEGMRALIELVTGAPATLQVAASCGFPD